MINQLFLKIGCVIVVSVLVVMLAPQVSLQLKEAKAQRDAPQDAAGQASLQVGEMNADAEPAEEGQTDVSGAAADRPRDVSLRVGKIAATPGRDEITRLQTLPILESEIRRLYTLAKDATCRMVTAGGAVLPNAASPLPGEASTIGRVPSITVGLEMAAAGRSKLPAVIRGQVDSYFEQHRLSIQPVVYCDAAGECYFGTDCQAAFFELERPGTAIQPEPMIESAVARFRSLGVFTLPENQSSSAEKRASASDSTSPSTSTTGSGSGSGSGRTLAMAFTFEKSEPTVSGVASSDHQVTELLLFHLPEQKRPGKDGGDEQASGPDIEMQVFITSDERRTLNRLDLRSTDINSPLPTISADIRFDKMILMGMYPAEPVVTQIHYRSAGVLSMELIEKLMKGSSDRSSLNLSEILDQFALLSQSLERPAARTEQSTSDEPKQVEESDEAWYQEMSRRKYERLDQSLQPIEKKDAPL